jgi:hypothetical protein
VYRVVLLQQVGLQVEVVPSTFAEDLGKDAFPTAVRDLRRSGVTLRQRGWVALQALAPVKCGHE